MNKELFEAHDLVSICNLECTCLNDRFNCSAYLYDYNVSDNIHVVTTWNDKGILYSEDGGKTLDWSNIKEGKFGKIFHGKLNNAELWLTTMTTGGIYISYNGKFWSNVEILADINNNTETQRISFGKYCMGYSLNTQCFILLGLTYDGVLYNTIDGVNWEKCFMNMHVVDAIHNFNEDIADTLNITDIAYHDHKWVASSSSARGIWTSESGIQFYRARDIGTIRTPYRLVCYPVETGPNDISVRSISFFSICPVSMHGRWAWLAGSEDKGLYKSDNGKGWEPYNCNAFTKDGKNVTEDMKKETFNFIWFDHEKPDPVNVMMVAVSNKHIYYSEDGVDWICSNYPQDVFCSIFTVMKIISVNCDVYDYDASDKKDYINNVKILFMATSEGAYCSIDGMTWKKCIPGIEPILYLEAGSDYVIIGNSSQTYKFYLNQVGVRFGVKAPDDSYKVSDLLNDWTRAILDDGFYNDPIPEEKSELEFEVRNSPDGERRLYINGALILDEDQFTDERTLSGNDFKVLTDPTPSDDNAKNSVIVSENNITVSMNDDESININSNNVNIDINFDKGSINIHFDK